MAQATTPTPTTPQPPKTRKKAVRHPLDDSQKTQIVQTRQQLSILSASNEIPSVLQAEVNKLMLLGNTQLWNRIKRAQGR